MTYRTVTIRTMAAFLFLGLASSVSIVCGESHGTLRDGNIILLSCKSQERTKVKFENYALEQSIVYYLNKPAIDMVQGAGKDLVWFARYMDGEFVPEPRYNLTVTGQMEVRKIKVSNSPTMADRYFRPACEQGQYALICIAGTVGYSITEE